MRSDITDNKTSRFDKKRIFFFVLFCFVCFFQAREVIDTARRITELKKRRRNRRNQCPLCHKTSRGSVRAKRSTSKMVSNDMTLVTAQQQKVGGTLYVVHALP